MFIFSLFRQKIIKILHIYIYIYIYIYIALYIDIYIKQQSSGS